MKHLRSILIILSCLFVVGTLYLLFTHNPFHANPTEPEPDAAVRSGHKSSIIAERQSKSKKSSIRQKTLPSHPPTAPPAPSILPATRTIPIQAPPSASSRSSQTESKAPPASPSDETAKEDLQIPAGVELADSRCSEANICPASVEQRLRKPILSPEDFKWCMDAFDPAIGGVVVGKSWGNLKNHEKVRFEALSCNNVNVTGSNPSCADSWGDEHVINWRRRKVVDHTCSFAHSPNIQRLFARSSSGFSSSLSSEDSSRIQCFRNEIQDTYCTFTNAQINFTAFDRINDTNGKDSTRRWHPHFLSIPCNEENFTLPDFKLAHLFSTSLGSPDRCDVYIPGVTLIYSHDIIMNLAHTLNDIMNVWLVLWLEGLGQHMKEVRLLTMDAMKSYHNWDDVTNAFFHLYNIHFKEVLRGFSFNQDPSKQIVCFEKLITPSLPTRGFVWQQWTVDALCSFVGPAALFQRWNLHVRQTMGLFSLEDARRSRTRQSKGGGGGGIGSVGERAMERNYCPKEIKIVLIHRNNSENMWGTYRSSRVIRNLPELRHSLESIAANASLYSPLPIRVVVQDFDLFASYRAQIEFMADVNILIGTHGAGIAHLNLLSLGSHYCCGVVEFFPRGEFFDIRGFGNMARRMGLHYKRIEISEKDSKHNGLTVRPAVLEKAVINTLRKIRERPACILPAVIDNPYLL